MFKREIGTFVLLFSVLFTGISIVSAKVEAPVSTTPVQSSSSEAVSEEYSPADIMDIVDHPDKYLAKKIKISALFSSFSILGLNYKPAFRDSKEYIGIIVQKPTKDQGIEIPLAELKIFIRRKIAEEFSDLENGDKLEIEGKVFSKALGDPWLEADHLKILSHTTKKTKTH